MYPLQHFNVHNKPFMASFRWVSHLLEVSGRFLLDLLISFEKAVKIARIAALDPCNYNREAIKRLMFED